MCDLQDSPGRDQNGRAAEGTEPEEDQAKTQTEEKGKITLAALTQAKTQVKEIEKVELVGRPL